MQIFNVLRGCIAAYLFGVLCLAGPYFFAHLMGYEEMSILGNGGAAFTTTVYGVVFASIITLPVIALWFLLALKKATVYWWFAVGAGAIAFQAVMSIFDSDFSFLILFLGCLYGAIFWMSAFGIKKSVILSFGRANNTHS